MLIEYKKSESRKSIAKLQDLRGMFFCAQALMKDKHDLRPHVNFIKVEKGTAYATDGARMHIYKPNTELKDGFYRVMKQLKTHVILHLEEDEKEYPKLEPVFKPFKKKKLKTIPTMLISEERFWGNMAEIIRAISEESALNGDFIKPLCGDDWDATIAENDMLRFCCVGQERKEAIIMSMRAN